MTGRRKLIPRTAKNAPRRYVRKKNPEGATAKTRPASRMGGLLLTGVILAGGLGFGSLYAFHALTERGLFQVRHIGISGQNRIPEDRILSRLDLPRDINLFDVDLQAVSGSVLTHPWIERVTVRRTYPSTINIRVWERTPAAILTRHNGSSTMMVDAEGVVLGAQEASAGALPRFTGLPFAGLVAGDRVDGKRVRQGLQVAKAWGNPDVLVDLGDAHDPLLLADGMRIRLGNNGGYDWRLDRLSGLREELRGIAGKQGAEVDLRYDDKVIARPL